jgi:hypothetical protein
MFTILAKGCLWHSVFPECWLCRFCFQGTLKMGVANSSEKLAAVYQIIWYYSRTPIILMLVIWIGLALWGKHFLTVIVLHLFVAEICPPIINTYQELCIYFLFACKWIWNLKQLFGRSFISLQTAKVDCKKKKMFIQIFCISEWHAIWINPDKWSSNCIS